MSQIGTERRERMIQRIEGAIAQQKRQRLPMVPLIVMVAQAVVIILKEGVE